MCAAVLALKCLPVSHQLCQPRPLVSFVETSLFKCQPDSCLFVSVFCIVFSQQIDTLCTLSNGPFIMHWPPLFRLIAVADLQRIWSNRSTDARRYEAIYKTGARKYYNKVPRCLPFCRKHISGSWVVITPLRALRVWVDPPNGNSFRARDRLGLPLQEPFRALPFVQQNICHFNA